MHRRWVGFVVSAAILVIVIYFLLPSSGAIHYFSPDTLHTRYQAEKLLPGTGIPIYRSGFHPAPSPLVDYLVRKGYWKPATTASPRWILTSHSNEEWKDGQSHLHREFYWHDEQWIEWSEQNPTKAAELWPQVLNILRNDLERGDSKVVELMWQAKD